MFLKLGRWGSKWGTAHGGERGHVRYCANSQHWLHVPGASSFTPRLDAFLPQALPSHWLVKSAIRSASRAWVRSSASRRQSSRCLSRDRNPSRLGPRRDRCLIARRSVINDEMHRVGIVFWSKDRRSARHAHRTLGPSLDILLPS
jgi:hypothetical protein